MDTVDAEKKLQERVLKWLTKDLGYEYIGNLEDTDNLPVKPELLTKNLKKRGYADDVIKKAVDDLVKKTKNQVDKLYTVNMDVYSALRYGRQGVKDAKGRNPVTVHYIDWKNAEENDFYVAEEVTVLRRDGKTRKRPDVVLYVNGIALAVFELKSSWVASGNGIRQMITNQKPENIPQFFSTAQYLFAGNEAEGLFYGTVETPDKFWLRWKEDKNAADELSLKIAALQGDEKNRLRRGIISLCQKERFLSLIYDFVIFDAGHKKVVRHNQYFANIAARSRIRAGEGGIIWNTQGSGKSLIMVWLTKWIMENIPDSRVVVITDREELDDQIESIFIDVGEKVHRARSCDDLRDVLTNHKEIHIICSLIHKYGHNAGKDADIELYRKELLAALPKGFKSKGRIIGFIDECHRTNSGKLHEAVKAVMPDAVLIGFTGTPLLKKDKETSLEIFGNYIHTYKFDEGVADGVVLDLRYEARDVDQDLTSQDKVDVWFDSKTRGLTARAKEQLKQSWTSMNKLFSSKHRLEKIAADILFDMETKPRLKDDRGTAMLVAGSIYEACRYWEIFQTAGFTKCAIVTSYEPTTAGVRTATSDLSKNSEEEYKHKIYTQMLNGQKPEEFETETKKLFKEEPAKMKLLIVRDKLLTGFDAPSATYLYIDKSMRDHDLFQAICRVNRPDGEDKDYGYIIDYMDLFRNVQLAVTDYTGDAFDNFDKEDVEGLIKNRYDEAKAEMDGSRVSLAELLANVDEPKADTDYIAYFCGEDGEEKEIVERRDTLYSLTASLSRSFAGCCDKLISNYDYEEEDVNILRLEIAGYNKIKEMIRLASNDYIDLKPYEADMRHILDTYIRAEDSKVISKLGDMTLVELLLSSRTTTPSEIIDDLPGDKEAKAETIENNLKHEIIKKAGEGTAQYRKLSEKLKDIIKQRKIGALSYEEYLRQVVELVEAVMHPENDDSYPEMIRESPARRELYDYFDKNEELAAKMDEAIRMVIEPGYKGNFQKERQIKLAICRVLESNGYTPEEADDEEPQLMDFVKRQEEYDG